MSRTLQSFRRRIGGMSLRRTQLVLAGFSGKMTKKRATSLTVPDVASFIDNRMTYYTAYVRSSIWQPIGLLSIGIGMDRIGHFDELAILVHRENAEMQASRDLYEWYFIGHNEWVLRMFTGDGRSSLGYNKFYGSAHFVKIMSRHLPAPIHVVKIVYEAMARIVDERRRDELNHELAQIRRLID